MRFCSPLSENYGRKNETSRLVFNNAFFLRAFLIVFVIKILSVGFFLQEVAAQDLLPIYSLEGREEILAQFLTYYQSADTTTAILDIDQIEQLFKTSPRHTAFKPLPKDGLFLGFSTQPLWVRIEIPPIKKIDELYVLETTYPLIDSLFLYEKLENGQWLVRKSGDRYPFVQRDLVHQNICFLLETDSEQPKVYYLRFATKGILQAQVRFFTPANFLSKTNYEALLFGGFFGLLGIMIVYGVLMGLLFKKRYFLAYSFTLLMAFFFIATLKGYAFQFFWPNAPTWGNEALPFFLGLLMASKATFIRKILHENSPMRYLERILWVLAWVGTGIATFVFMGSYAFWVQVSVLIGVLTVLVCFVGMVLGRARGADALRYAVFGTYSFVVAILFLVLRLWGVMEITFLTHYGLEVGLISYALSFALALHDLHLQARLAAVKTEEKAELF
jgi:hypothetical protein